MAETDPKVMSLVEAALAKDPAVSVQELYDMAKKSKRSIRQMSLRQFHARYPLQIKRKKGNAARKRRRATGAPQYRAGAARRAKSATPHSTRSAAAAMDPDAGTMDRDAVRSTLLGFASDLAAAHSRSDAVGVVANVDKYVAQIERACR